MDDQGHWAATGQVAPALLNQWLQDDYFQQPFPKSTDREYYIDHASIDLEQFKEALKQVEQQAIKPNLNDSLDDEDGMLAELEEGLAAMQEMVRLSQELEDLFAEDPEPSPDKKKPAA